MAVEKHVKKISKGHLALLSSYDTRALRVFTNASI